MTPTTRQPPHSSGRTLPPLHLRLAVADCLRCPDPAAHRLDAIQERLWRETPDDVAKAYDALILGSLDGGPREGGSHGLLAEEMRRLRRPLPTRDRRGMTVTAIAEQAGLNRETLACLMEHHGYMEMVPFGGRQQRRLVTDYAFKAEMGHNVDASRTRVARLEGGQRACVFPVFYPEHVAAILWTLDYPGIVRNVAAIRRKRDRLEWLVAHHSYLPKAAMAELSGYSRSGIEKGRERFGSAAPLCLVA